MQRNQQMASEEPLGFNATTRQNFIPGPVFTFPSGQTNLTLTQNLPQTAYGAAVNILVQGTTTTAAASSTTASTSMYPYPPLGYIKRIRLYNNQNVDLFNITGQGLYLWDVCQRTHWDPLVAQVGQFIGGFTPTAFAQTFVAPTSLGASATQTWQVMLRLGISWGEALTYGLQLLQDQSVQYPLEITVGAPSDIYSATTGTVTISSVITTEVELYSIPPDSRNQPELSLTQVVLEDLKVDGFSAGADLNYKIVPGNVVTHIIHELAQGSPLAPFSPANIGRLAFQYSQVQTPYNTPFPFHYFRQRRIYGRDLPPGVVVHSLEEPNGFPDLKGGRDLVNLAQITDATSIVGIPSGAPLTNPQLRTVRTLLAANR
jgi:hypothetical protein